MDRGEKKEGVRQGRPTRRGTADILKEADRIIRERIHEIEKERGRSVTPLLAFLCGMAVSAVLFIVIPLVLRAM